MRKSSTRWLLALAGLLLAGAAGIAWLNLRGEASSPQLFRAPGEVGAPASAAMLEKGAYLARAGNCMGCHTAQGGKEYAGGRAMQTPFGVIHASNLTPDPDTGLGRWTPDAFWRALHHGRSQDGRLLYPAFPYPQYTRVLREDADALFAYLQSLAPVHAPAKPHQLTFPFNTQAALAVWRARYFRAGEWQPRADAPAEWNRGAYLVQGLGHCAACHSARNSWGASVEEGLLRGGMMALQDWYAPALGGGLGEAQDLVRLLRTGVSSTASASGPMAEVVFRSTQYLSTDDLQAMAAYLQTLPAPRAPAGPVARAGDARLGAKVYTQHCAQCHGEQGEGRPGAFIALAGNRAVNLPDGSNVVRMVLQGGYPPATQGNPRPHGMPPFSHQLSDAQIAAVSSFVRQSWGNMAPAVGTIEVYRAREKRRQ
ncbi:cytochrome c [Pantoea sp. 18069]|uniref:cytochrome c n=1 Tax=Pantoea sp. 18069 TaxID=2681415 RepID=UPI0013588DF0|nr:cytochrome c [Pantoea sp. 18069]